MSNVRTRIGGLIATGCVVALMVAGVTPALAHHRDDHQQGNEDPSSEAERFDESDDDGTQERGSSAPRSRRAQSESQTTTSSTDGSDDPAGKNYDAEGEPRGETETSCSNDKSEAGDPRRIYDNTCDGRAGKAGSGGGSAQGRPCAGCVGNADDQNPKGQMDHPNRDGNAGYECDGNNGVARDNPAHTGCPDEVEGRTDTSEPVKVCPEGPFEGMPMTSPRDCPVPDRVLPRVIRGPAKPLGKAVPAGGVLPFTGAGNALSFVGAALVLINTGSLALIARRKDRPQQ